MMTTEKPQDHRTVQHAADPTARPLKVLAVIDGSEQTGRVIEYALSLGKSCRPLDVVLLGLVQEPSDGRLRGYGSFKRKEVHAHLKERMDQRAISAAARRFDHANIAHKDRIEIGDPAESILRVAKEEGAGIILIGDAPAGIVRRWLPKAIGLSLATTAIQIAQQAAVPVVVLK